MQWRRVAIFRKDEARLYRGAPGALTDVIAEVKERTGVPILAGGFIRTVDDVESFKCWCDSNYDIKTRTMETLPKK